MVHPYWAILSKTEWPCKKETREKGHQDTSDNNEGVYQLRCERLCLNCWMKKPLLKKTHIKAHIKFTKRHFRRLNGQVEESFCSDRTKTELFGHQTRRYVWRTPKNHTSPLLWNLVVAELCCEDASLQQILGSS